MSHDEFMRGVWWRPADARAQDSLRELLEMRVTDVCVWAEPFIERVSEWHELRRQVQEVGIRFHTWITVNHHYAQVFRELLTRHPEWLAYDRAGNSSVDKPLAGIQVWPCPANVARREADWALWRPLIAGADGLHLDYIRYPDGFRFGAKPEIGRHEVAEQSYCYCPSCRQAFAADHALDPMTIDVEARGDDFRAWQRWRQDRIVEQVAWYRDRLSEVSAEAMMSAAVFPTPDIARENVQQDWARFAASLDFVCPMIYAKQFWGQPVSWTQAAVVQARKEVPSRIRIVAGIGPHDSYLPAELAEAAVAGRAGGADGEMIFVYPMDRDHVAALRAFWASDL
ncbi:MAG: family 10 glycosylhydrolase [Firmicutes bacterium]|nr:family 10 glycosylhydrolase [Bacillota bacterium]